LDDIEACSFDHRLATNAVVNALAIQLLENQVSCGEWWEGINKGEQDAQMLTARERAAAAVEAELLYSDSA